MAGVVAGHGAAPITRAAPTPAKSGCQTVSVAASSHNAGQVPSLTSRRAAVSSTAVLGSLPFFQALFPRRAEALIEADDDEELLEKVKGDRQKRLEKREVLVGLKDETAYVQNAVYQMSKTGQAIEKNDFTEAGSILGATDWVSKTKAAFAKVGKSPEEKDQADIFASSLDSLQTAGIMKFLCSETPSGEGQRQCL